MRTASDMFEYQQKATVFQCDHDASALWLDMGLGKTAITLTTIAHKLNTGEVKAVVIVAPIRVCRLVWRQEALKWSHTNHLTFSMMLGDRDQRTRGLLNKANIYLINYDNLEWLATALKTYYVAHGREMPFDGIVFDEITKCKNSSTNRVKALRKILTGFKWRTGLTGTPAANGYTDLHGQYLVLDDGKRLGSSKTQFQTRWYRKEGKYKSVPYADTDERIKELIGDMTLEMSAADYNPLPDMITNNIEIALSPELQEKYDEMEKQFFIQLDSGTDVEIFNSAALTNKCLQFSSGFMYPISGMPLWETIHDEKLNALEEIIEEAGGEPILCAYNYRADAERIMEKFKYLHPINLTECKSEKALNDAMSRWRNKSCQLMLGHPASMGHGLDGLQHTGNTIVWYGMNWSLDLYDQFNARIRRQGQGKPVICHRIICPTTLDMAQVLAVEEKSTTQTALRKAVKQYRHIKNNPLQM
jgi:SNF2 family DNA or RNA helicase